jgi:hypothetical protein
MNLMSPNIDSYQALEEVANALGLEPGQGGMFIGRIHEFPVGLKHTGAGDLLLVLFELRHLRPSGAKEFSNVQYDGEVQRLIADKKLEIELENKIAWLTFPKAVEQLADKSIPRLVESVLGSFAAADLGGNNKTCHYCGRNQVERPICCEGKIAQICPACLSERLEDPKNRTAEATEGVLSASLLGSLAAIVGAAAWCICWIGYVLLFESLNAGSYVVPLVVESAALVVVSLVTGGPVGFAIKRIQRRGQAVSMTTAILFSAGAVVIGEVLFMTWFIYHETGVFSPAFAWHILPRLEAEFGVYYLLIKLLSAIFAIFLAAHLAKPPKPKIKL